MCFNGSYGSVCDVGWDDEDASVVCRSYFGFENGLSKYSSVLDGGWENIAIPSIVCVDMPRVDNGLSNVVI